ncbi:hypothetical protein MKP05_13615 [Halomonas sp. EGI 63088]|uniref:DUF1127 domain-containing protein n=1 Tax=Halomonas flagellata TaxID=2920385 RepID=A0ABS9RWF6_9GAMM|nr:hypothetical protein [Halomonas flagellata]MCH4564150.1 hypothetical protein [Halomonas flagellata]
MSQYEPIRRPRVVADKPAPPPAPDFYMPAMPPLGLITAVEHWWHVYRRRRQFRRRFLPLLAHDDHILEDMGHHRDDILWASRLPLQVDALKALEECRALRKAQQDPFFLLDLKRG